MCYRSLASGGSAGQVVGGDKGARTTAQFPHKFLLGPVHYPQTWHHSTWGRPFRDPEGAIPLPFQPTNGGCSERSIIFSPAQPHVALCTRRFHDQFCMGHDEYSAEVPPVYE